MSPSARADSAGSVRSESRWPVRQPGISFGGDYNPEQWPRATWDDDIQRMLEARINLVSVGIFTWGLLEPREGEYDFTQLDEVMDLLAVAGIGVDLATPTASPPAWFWRKYPQARPVTREGVPLGFGSRGMASPSSPEYRRAAVAITRQLAARYADHPALRMWHVHNEYGAPTTESFDEDSVCAFRRWLQAKYGSVDGLNMAWGTSFWGQHYEGWEEIDAPRLAATTLNPAQLLDFARFSSNALLECFKAERDAIKEFTPHLPVTTNFMATTCLTVDYWKWAEEVDVVANDHYLIAERDDNHVLLAMDADLTRSIAGGRPWMLMEHSTSAVNWQPRNIAKRPGEMARNSFSHLARGADAIMFFQFRASRAGAEKFHSAMLPHGGTQTRVWREVVRLGNDLSRLSELAGSVVLARVAILWDWESFWAQDLEMRPSIDNRHRVRIEQYYAALWRLGITVDFVHPEADLGQYAVVLAPSSYLLSEKAGKALDRYVDGGGHLVVSFGGGMVDENDSVHAGGSPGPLRGALGLSVEEVLPFRVGMSAPLDVGGSGSVWAEDIRLEGAVALSRFVTGHAAGQPVVTRSDHGSGHAWYVATALDDSSIDQVMEDVLMAADAAFLRPSPGLEVVDRRKAERTYRIFINHSDDDIVVSANGVELLGNQPVAGTLRVHAGSVKVLAADSQELHS